MSYLPLNYEQINYIEGTYIPSNIKIYNTQSFKYWQRSLTQRAMSVFEFTLPDDWTGTPKNLFDFWLLYRGFLAVFDRPEFGFTFNPCSINGYDWYYQPVNVLVSNPALKKSLEMKVGKDCELLRLTHDYVGIWDIITYYSEKLANLDNAINTAITNSKIAWILGAKNKSSAEAIKKALDNINKGECAVILDSRLINTSKKPNDTDEPWNLIDLEVKKNYILADLLKETQTLLNCFDAEIGIPSVPYQKAERMVTSEADSRMIDSQARCSVWLDCLKNSIDIINKHYNSNLDVKLRYERGDISGIGNNEPMGD